MHPPNDNKQEAPSNEQVYEWLDATAALIIAKLEKKISAFRENPTPGRSAPTIEQQARKFEFLEKLLGIHKEWEPPAKRPKAKSEVHRIINGFLTEFIRQSENGTPPCNIENDRNPEARAYWESRPPEEFKDAAVGGIFHSAAGHKHLKKRYTKVGERSAEFHALGEIIRTTIDTFKEEYPKLDTRFPLNPSVYNDHMAVIAMSSGIPFSSAVSTFQR